MKFLSEHLDRMVGKILNLIEELYCKKYTGRIEVDKLPVGYAAKFWLDKNNPTLIAAEIEDPEQFLKFMREELRTRYWHHNVYAHII